MHDRPTHGSGLRALGEQLQVGSYEIGPEARAAVDADDHIDIAERWSLPFATVKAAAEALASHGLLKAAVGRA